MMVDAMRRTLSVADNVGILGFFVDAKDQGAQHYYQRFGFHSLPGRPLEMYLLIRELQAALSTSESWDPPLRTGVNTSSGH